MSGTDRPHSNRTGGEGGGSSAARALAALAADRFATLRRDDQRATALRGVRPTARLAELAAELERRGAANLLALVHAERGRRAAIRAENEAYRAEAAALRERRGKVVATFARGMTVDLRGRTYTLMEARRTMSGIDGWSVSSVRYGTWFHSNDELADAMLASTEEGN